MREPGAVNICDLRRKPVVELVFSQFDEQFTRQLFNLEAQELPDTEMERSELAVVVELILSQLPREYERVLRLKTATGAKMRRGCGGLWPAAPSFPVQFPVRVPTTVSSAFSTDCKRDS